MSSESMGVVTLTADDSPLAVCASIVAELRNQTLNRQHSHSSHDALPVQELACST